MPRLFLTTWLRVCLRGVRKAPGKLLQQIPGVWLREELGPTTASRLHSRDHSLWTTTSAMAHYGRQNPTRAMRRRLLLATPIAVCSLYGRWIAKLSGCRASLKPCVFSGRFDCLRAVRVKLACVGNLVSTGCREDVATSTVPLGRAAVGPSFG